MREMSCELFFSEEDAETTRKWIGKVEKILVQIKVLDDLWEDYVNKLLIDRTQFWWEIVQSGRTIESWTWGDFRIEFENQFYSRYHQKMKEQEFLALR
jgi:hypothetical protein